MRRRHFLFASMIVPAFLACSTKKDAKFEYGEPKQRYALKGVVLRLKPADRVAVVQHEKIEGWMEAMTMEFPVPDAAEYAKLKEGAKIRSTVYVNDLYYWLTSITLE
jgi:Cu/Ag efflux protein CusF